MFKKLIRTMIYINHAIENHRFNQIQVSYSLLCRIFKKLQNQLSTCIQSFMNHWKLLPLEINDSTVLNIQMELIR